MILCKHCLPFCISIIFSVKYRGVGLTAEDLAKDIEVSKTYAEYLIQEVIMGRKAYPIIDKKDLTFCSCSAVKAGKNSKAKLLKMWVKEFTDNYPTEKDDSYEVKQVDLNTYRIVNKKGMVVSECCLERNRDE